MAVRRLPELRRVSLRPTRDPGPRCRVSPLYIHLGICIARARSGSARRRPETPGGTCLPAPPPWARAAPRVRIPGPRVPVRRWWLRWPRQSLSPLLGTCVLSRGRTARPVPERAPGIAGSGVPRAGRDPERGAPLPLLLCEPPRTTVPKLSPASQEGKNARAVGEEVRGALPLQLPYHLPGSAGQRSTPTAPGRGSPGFAGCAYDLPSRGPGSCLPGAGRGQGCTAARLSSRAPEGPGPGMPRSGTCWGLLGLHPVPSAGVWVDRSP
ncbi:PREDICTED: translation initiation factor IF-2-like [Chinchilla lanigera]|uniref:translation initiation factor IF-2-like n=1 Tax=Chinchilla lanigera TaxID=34839 RepID=UPI000697048D|nr:PREDICTED: translation initiation factor IF-2-like [Chinchilla lanigera]